MPVAGPERPGDDKWEQSALGGVVFLAGLIPDAAGCWVCLLPGGEALPVIGQQPVGQGRDGLVEPPDIGDEYG